MKYTLLFLLYVIIFQASLNAQEIPNNSFESWLNVGDYENPEFWDTGNNMNSGVGVVTTTKSEDSNSGSFSARLETKNFLTFTVPGLVTLGDFEVDIWTQESSITGGVPFDIRPDKISVYYKYNPAEGDNMRIGMWLLRDDGTDVPDTVATALYESTETVSNFTKITLDIDYRSNETPEILNIIAVSSNPDNPIDGSVLYVDDFMFECSTGILNVKMSNNIVYPNPAENILMINHNYINDKIEILDKKGKLVKTNNPSVSDNINISNLPAGVYFIRITRSNENIIINQKILKI